MARVKQLLEDFASLHKGGTIAYVKDRIKPVKQIDYEDYLQAVTEQLMFLYERYTPNK